jgi:hypothetical protein
MTSSSTGILGLESVTANCRLSRNDTKNDNNEVLIQQLKITLPSLSLDHQSNTRHGSDDHRSSDESNSELSSSDEHDQKEVAEQLAISLLSRPMTFTKECQQVFPLYENANDEELNKILLDTGTHSFDDVMSTLLDNALSSFAILVDSRLHAYAAFLRRHAVMIARDTDRANGVRSCYEDNDTSSDDSDHHDDQLLPSTEVTSANDRVRCVKNKIEAILQVGNLLAVRSKSIRFVRSSNNQRSDVDVTAVTTTVHSSVELFLTIDFHLPAVMPTIPDTLSSFSVDITAPVAIHGTYYSSYALLHFSLSIYVCTERNDLLFPVTFSSS